MTLIEPGRKAPAIRLKDQSGRTRSLKDLAGRMLVLYFYPKDDTPTCTTEACDFRDHLPDFRKVKATVVGISPDDPASHRRFIDRHDLNVILLADEPGPDGVPPVCRAYGVWADKMMFGRRVKGVVRTTYLIDGSGVVLRRWDRVRVKGHVRDVLETIRLHGDGDGKVRRAQRRGRRDSQPAFTPIRGPAAARRPRATGAPGRSR